MNRLLPVAVAVLVAGCGDTAAPPTALSPALSPAPYTLEDLGTLGGASSVALAINGQGQIVGRSLTGNGQTHAFLYANGVLQDLGTLGGTISSAEAINEAGQVAGRSTTAAGEMRAVLWTNGTMLDLGPASDYLVGNEFGYRVIHLNGQGQVTWGDVLWTNGGLIQIGSLGGGATGVSAISDCGDVVGWSTVPSGQAHAFLWRDGVMNDLGDGLGLGSEAMAINAVGQVVGAVRINSGQHHAVLWDDGNQTDLGRLPGDGTSQALAINDLGWIAGWSAVDDLSTNRNAFRWQAGVMVALGPADYGDQRVTGMNQGGAVIGYETYLRRIDRARVWDGTLAWDLGTLGGESSLALAINDDGMIVGRAQDSSGAYRAVAWRPAAALALSRNLVAH